MLIQNIALFFSGVYFPITVLPEFLQPVAIFVPFYYSIEGLRKSLRPTIITAENHGVCLEIIPFSYWGYFAGNFYFSMGIEKAKIDGSLAFY